MNYKALAGASVLGVALLSATAYAGPFGIKVNVPTPSVNVTTSGVQVNTGVSQQPVTNQNATTAETGSETPAVESTTNAADEQIAPISPSEKPEPKPSELVDWQGWKNASWTLDGMNAPRDARLYLVEYTGTSSTPRYHAEGKHVVFENIKSGQCIAWGNSEPGKINAANFKGKNTIYLIAVYPGVGFDWYTKVRSDCKSYDDMSIRSTTPMRGKGMKFFDGLAK